MNGLQSPTLQLFELAGEAVATTMVLAIQRATAAAAFRPAAPSALGFVPHFM